VPGGANQDFDQTDLLAGVARPDPDDLIARVGGLMENSRELVDEVGLGPGDEGDRGQGQLGEQSEVGVAQIDDQQRPRRDGGQNLGPIALIVRRGLLLVPDLARQTGAQIEQRGHAPGQRCVGTIFEQADLADQRVQGRPIGGENGGEVIASPGQFAGQRPLARLRPGEQRRHQGEEDVAKQNGRKDPQPLGEGLLGDLDWCRPKETLLVQQVQQGADRADLPPNHAQDQRDHHRQGEGPLAQAQIVKMSHLGQRKTAGPDRSDAAR